MGQLLSENEWLSNRNNTLRVLYWCVGNIHQATLLANSLQHYILTPFPIDSIRKIHNSIDDSFANADKVIFHLLDMITYESHDSKNEKNRLLSQLDSSHSDIILELIFALAKTHSLHFFPNSFYSKLLSILSSQVGCDSSHIKRPPVLNSINSIFSEYFSACMKKSKNMQGTT